MTNSLASATLLVLLCAPGIALAQSKVDKASVGQQYQAYLADFHEPDLATAKDTTETYRALWVRSFHEPVSVRLYAWGGRFYIITNQGNRRDSTELNLQSWNDLHLRTAMKKFWTSHPIPLPNGEVGLDGARWVLEGRHGTTYHAVDWWSPKQESEGVEGGYARLFLEILSLGTVCVKPDAVY